MHFLLLLHQKERFSQDEANISVILQLANPPIHRHIRKSSIDEPRCEKTGLRGFLPGPTQIRLYSHRRWLEA